MTNLAQDLFARAYELNPAERDAFLAQACGDDAELHLEVQRLLVDAERADSFFGDDDGTTIGAGDFSDTYAEKEGDVIGPYKLRQQIGEGGFGAVWMAEQKVPISRMVALKVIKAGMDTKEVLTRFEAERQAVAMMDHPNIAKVLDAGATPAGRPYFAMELVKGMPITQFCEQQKFGPRRRLELFRDVCAAVNHAHQKGIIHRDLKPSNIMVTLEADRPVVKVIDFGIAKATHSKLTEKTLFTRFEQFLGTPVYMSPEQAAMSNLDVDTRSDIYSLGVLLYELLAGAPPFDSKSLLSAGYDEMRRIIAEDEPPKPSTRATQTQASIATGSQARKALINASSLKGDLDWIVMKAIEKNRARRYETANAFAADIGRFLADEPVLAAAPTATYKFRKFARRNKATIGIAAGIALVLVAATAVSSWQAVRATRAQVEAVAEREKALAAQENEREARQDAEAISNFLTGMFESAQPGGDGGGREVKVADIIDDATEKLASNKEIRPDRRVRLEATLALTYYTLGLRRESIPLMEKVRDYRLATVGLEHPDTLAAMGRLAAGYQALGQLERAITMQEEVLTLSRKVRGAEDPETLRAMNNLAGSYFAAERRDEALPMVEQLLALSRSVNGPEHPDTLRFMVNLAALLSFAGQMDKALAMNEQLVEISRKVNGPEHPDTLAAMNGLANCYLSQEKKDEALLLFEKVVELDRKVLGPEHPWTLEAMNGLREAYSVLGRAEEALQLAEQVYALVRKQIGPEHPHSLMVMRNLAYALVDVDRLKDALVLLEEASALTRKVSGPDHPDVGQLAASIGDIHRNLGDLDKAVVAWQEAIRIDPQFLIFHYNLGEALFAMERYQEALPSLQAARDQLPPSDPRHAENKDRLEQTLAALGREKEAEGQMPGTDQ